jgi:hypothetical protein
MESGDYNNFRANDDNDEKYLHIIKYVLYNNHLDYMDLQDKREFISLAKNNIKFIRYIWDSGYNNIRRIDGEFMDAMKKLSPQLDFFTAAHIFTVVRDIKAICLHYDIDI